MKKSPKIAQACADGLLLAFKAAGSQTNLRRALKIRSPGSISSWKRTGRIPAEHVMAVCELTGLAPSLIRPDIYPPGYIPRVIGGKAHSEPKAADKPAPADQVG